MKINNKNNTNLSTTELEEFISLTSGIAGYSKILNDGFQYVDDLALWNWLKNPYKSLIKNNFQDWLLSQSPSRLDVIIRSKGFEWDLYRQYHPQIIDRNIIHSIKYSQKGKDLINKSISGNITNIQAKTFISKGQISNARNTLSQKKYNLSKFAVNEKVFDSSIKKGMSRDRFVKVVPDEEIRNATNRRINQVKNSNLQYNITLNGVLKQAGKGALIGAVIGIGSSTIINYKNYKNGIISFEEYRNVILKEGAKSALTGSSLAVINIGIQYSAELLGFGFPITIPVMIIVGIGLNSIIDPIFKDGKYKEILEKIEISNDIQKGYYDFGILSLKLFSYQNDLILNSIDSLERIESLDKVYKHVNDEFDIMSNKLKKK